jgi:hypothetical protein
MTPPPIEALGRGGGGNVWVVRRRWHRLDHGRRAGQEKNVSSASDNGEDRHSARDDESWAALITQPITG